MRRWIVVLLLLGGAATVAIAATTANVVVEPLPAHDVQFSVLASGVNRPMDVAAMLRGSLGCRWDKASSQTTLPSGAVYLTGTCRGLLTVENGAGEGSLRLAPLADAMHAAGIRSIAFDVMFPDGVNASPPPIQGWDRSHEDRFDYYHYYSRREGETPPALPVQLTFQPQPLPAGSRKPVELMPLRGWNARALLTPLVVLALAPLVLAMWIRRLSRGPAMGWARWLFTAVWLYWIGAVDLGNVAALVTGPAFPHAALSVIAGVLLYVGPPAAVWITCAMLLRPVWRRRDNLLARLAGAMAAAPGLSAIFAILYVSYRVYESAPWVWVASIAAVVAIVMFGKRLLGSGAEDLAPLRGRYASIRGAAILVAMGACTIYVPALAMVDRGNSLWGRSLPFALLACLLALAQLSQCLTLAADARGAAASGDAEGAISAIGLAAQRNDSPLDCGMVPGALDWSPSPRRRSLALARRFRIAPERALALLDDHPVEDGQARRPTLQGAPLFDKPAIVAHVITSIRWKRVFLIAGSLAVYAAAYSFGPERWHLAMYACGAAGLFWCYHKLDVVLDRRFLRKMEQRMGLPRGGTAVCLRAGDVLETNGYYPWDLGRLFFTADGLVYAGERARFRVPREVVTGIEWRRGPLCWERNCGLVVKLGNASFSLEPLEEWHSERAGRAIESQLRTWWTGGGAAQSTEPWMQELDAPDLPPDAAPSFVKWKVGLHLAMRVAGLLFVTTLTMMMADIARVQWIAKPGGIRISSLVTTPIPLTPPVLHAIWVFPLFFHPERREVEG